MKIGKFNSITLLLLIFFLLPLGMLAAKSAPKTDINGLVREYFDTLMMQKKQGRDVARAEELNHKSREAMAQGNPQLAVSLLKDAINSLKSNPSGSQESFNEPKLPTSSAVNKTINSPVDSDSMRSPFGIFGPYQFKLDSKDIMTHEKINLYLADLGVKWVQEMPMGINYVPSTINIYSRAGREGGVKPPNIDYEKYKSSLRESIGLNKGRVKFWEVDTEPGGLRPPQGWRGYEKEYTFFLKETYSLIKKECPDCMVVLGGAGGIAGFRREDPSAAFVRKILDYGAGEYFDVFSFKMHHYKVTDYADIKNKLEIYSKIFADHHIDLKKKIIFLESGIYDGNPDYAPGHPLSFITLPPQTEFQQAAGLVKLYVSSIALGVDRIFWNEVFERHNFGGEKRNPFNFYGLVNNPLNDDGKSHKKLAYYTYKKMIEILEGSDWKNITALKGQSGVHVYKLNRHGKAITVAWNDGGVDSISRITGIPSPRVKVTYAVPDVPSGLDMRDFGTSFKSCVVHTEDNAISLALGGSPVYIEELE